ncbi:winged helix-turn-helix domain-containing protein [Streptomyces iconiensis]|uniref:Winged helix-turn-helix domain-containing protein n=1 Tax=Streptomyces iconiensis TaxID=1384038 RepID=A0ABT7A8W7_9ACTN|nr:winged helix-turn-helix domain-containing protein [Streptomyces iconiensis]MDJ1137774.1 winged helix-turn-helix domain-containing protein [Streptomyces iconiensis]
MPAPTVLPAAGPGRGRLRGGQAVGYLVVVPEGTDPAELPHYVARAEAAYVEAVYADAAHTGAANADAVYADAVYEEAAYADAAYEEAAYEETAARTGAGVSGAGSAPGRGEGVEIDRERHTVHVDGAELALTYLEFELLAHLAAHPHRVHSREHLIAGVWGYGQHIGDGRTVDVHIARLRRKLGPAHRARIVTVRRVGYKYAP